MKTFDDYDPHKRGKRGARIHMLITSYPKLKPEDINDKLEEHFGEIFTGLSKSVKDQMEKEIKTWLPNKRKTKSEIKKQIAKMNKITTGGEHNG